MAKLKVYRTAIGFHDAYVAASSMKAALEAWGAGGNLFATGMAEIVSDAELTKAPLAEPGKVIKVVRGTDAEHFEALRKTPPKAEKPTPNADATAAKKPAKPKPRPSRTSLDLAEAARAEAEARDKVDRDTLAKKEAELREERRRLEAAQESEAAKLQSNLARENAAYEKAMQKWRKAL